MHGGKRNKIKWTSKMLVKLGTNYDSVIARELNISNGAVKDKREELLIPIFGEQRMLKLKEELNSLTVKGLIKEFGVSRSMAYKLKEKKYKFRE